MLNPGPFLRNHFPRIYFSLVYLINGLRKVFTPYSIYVTDTLGGSFKEYMAGHDMGKKISALKEGLDETSSATVDIIIKRVSFYPGEKSRHKISKNEPIAGGLLEGETAEAKKRISTALKEAGREFRLHPGTLEESVFYYFHGLILLPPVVRDHIAGREFLDIGAFTGDSAIALTKFNYSKIFSVEMSLKSIEKYRANMARSGIESDRYVIINSAVVSDDIREPVRLPDTGSAGLSLMRHKGKYDEIEIEQHSVDYLVEKYKITPGFIKVDIEGSALEFVKGAVKTLSLYRPVISIAVYHNPYEFFEVKPMLEEILNNYIFLIRKLSMGIKNNLCHSDVFLIGYPSEVTG